MRGPKYTATAVREPGGQIVVDTKPTSSISDKYPILKKPLLRGCVALYESLVIGMGALSFSAKAAGEEEETMSNKEIALTMVFSTVLAIALFLALPTYAAKWIPGIGDNHFVLNLVEGAIRLSFIFDLYMGHRSNERHSPCIPVSRAEHKTIHTYESDVPLTVENVREHSRLHARCGTNFLLIVMVTSIFVFAFLGWPSLWERIISRVLLMPVVAGIAYEMIRLAGRSESVIVKALITPGLWLQYMTTREPDDDQIEVAIRALESVRPAEEDAYES